MPLVVFHNGHNSLNEMPLNKQLQLKKKENINPL